MQQALHAKTNPACTPIMKGLINKRKLVVKPKIRPFLKQSELHRLLFPAIKLLQCPCDKKMLGRIEPVAAHLSSTGILTRETGTVC
jgi:hypothetical protein